MTLESIVTFTRAEFFWLFYLTAGWLAVWGAHALLLRFSATYRASPWSWYRLAGLVLLLFPFIRILNGIWESIDVVAQRGTVAPTRSAEVWWRIIRQNMVQNFALPLFGLVLASGYGPRLLWGLRQAGQGLRATLASVGMWPRVSWTRDLATGLAAFLVVFFGYVMLSNLLAPLRGWDTGDASRVFDAVTPLLAISLALMSGLTEEFLYRGVLFVRMRSVFPRVPAWSILVGSSLFFGLAHAGYGTIANMVFPFLFGLVVGTIVWFWGVWPAVIVHTLVNFMIFLGRLHQRGFEWTVYAANGVILVALAVPLVYFGTLVFRHWTRRRDRGATRE